jgi:hypothetical protein
MQARVVPAAADQGIPLGLGRNKAVVAAVVVTVSVEVCAVEPLKFVSEAGESAQVAGSLEATGVIAHVRATVAVNPPAGVTLIVDVLPVDAPGATVMLPLLETAKLGGTAVTVTEPAPAALL